MENIWNKFKNDLENGVNKCIPHKTASTKAKLPWITSEINHLMRKRDRVYKSKLKTGSDHYNGIFITLKAEIQRKLRRSYWEYIQGLITPDAENTGDRPSLSKRFYTYLKNNKTDTNGIASLRDGGPFQHGFRRNRSCETQRLQFTTDIATILAADKQTDVLVMDFSKAFDIVQMPSNVKHDQPGFLVCLTFFDGFCFTSTHIFRIRLMPPWHP